MTGTALACKPLAATSARTMTLKTIYLLTIIFFVFSCGQRTGTSHKQTDTNTTPTTPDQNQVQYIKNVIAVGKKVFIGNCFGCHCGPGTRCEPPYSGELRPYFDRLPMDSLEHYMVYIKNSTLTKKGLRKSSFVNENIDNFNHEFEKTLSDSLIKTVIEYIWLGYKHKD